MTRVIGALVLASAMMAQEHSDTPADIENDARLYQSSCAGARQRPASRTGR